MVRDAQLEFLDRNPVIKSQGRGHGSRAVLNDSIMSSVVTEMVRAFYRSQCLDRSILYVHRIFIHKISCDHPLFDHPQKDAYFNYYSYAPPNAITEDNYRVG